MKRLVLLAFLAGCVRHAESSESARSDSHTTVEQHGSEQTVTTRVEEPDQTTTTTDEFTYESPENGDARDAGSDVDAGVPAAAVKRLVRRTVRTETSGRVTEETRQAVRTDAAAQTTQATATQAQQASGSKPSFGCAVAGWMWGVAILVAVAGIALGAWKLRRGMP